MKHIPRIALPLALAAVPTLALQGTLTASRISSLTPEQAEILSHLSIVYLDDGQGGLTKTIRVEGVNLQLVNGLEATNGNPGDPLAVAGANTQTNGLGNLIVGYNELRGAGDDRTGSHNLVIGIGQNVVHFGGAAIGRTNDLRAPYSSVLGGTGNLVSGVGATISGGRDNSATGSGASISGGRNNVASGIDASVSGGNTNTASGDAASVAGGTDNNATGNETSILGGRLALASGTHAAVVGGNSNIASGPGCVAVGGKTNTAGGNEGVVAGGTGNSTSASQSTVSGGMNRAVDDDYDWRAGSLVEGE